MVGDPFVRVTRESYDAAIADYLAKVAAGASADRWPVGPDIAVHPLERALSTAFAESVRATGNATVADVGSGLGRATAALAELGLDVFGVDLSPAMVTMARRDHPGLRFEVGSMLALDIPDGSLGGVLASYSIIHVPWAHRPRVFVEFHRVLAPGGYLLIAFQVGDERRHFDGFDGLAFSLDFYRQQPDDVAALLATAGFDVRMRMRREPEDREHCPHGAVLARKPPAPGGPVSP
jgi:SAM-dependent methyltransferase